MEIKVECVYCGTSGHVEATREEVSNGFNVECPACGKTTNVKEKKSIGGKILSYINGSNAIKFLIFLIIVGLFIGFILPSTCPKNNMGIMKVMFSSCELGSYINTNLFSSDNQQKSINPTATGEAITTDDIIKNIEQSIVNVKYDVTALDENNKQITIEAFGSGIIYYNSSSEIEVYTNRHVVDCLFTGDCSSKINEKITVRTNGGTIYDVKQVSFAPHNLDIASLTLGKKSNDFKTAGWYLDYAPKIGDKVIAIGYPKAPVEGSYLEFLRTTGEINNLKDFLTADQFGFKVIESDALTNHGSSGGGLFSNEGNLIGIVTWGDAQSRTTIAIDIKTIKDLGNFKYCAEGYYSYLDKGCVSYCNSDEILEINGGKYACFKPCDNFYCNSEIPIVNNPRCRDAGLISGSDGYCHKPCSGSNSYCSDNWAYCYKNRCILCPPGEILYTNGICR